MKNNMNKKEVRPVNNENNGMQQCGTMEDLFNELFSDNEPANVYVNGVCVGSTGPNH